MKKVAGEIAAEGFDAKGYPCDCLSKESCQAAREQIHRDFGPCDILLNGAGGQQPPGHHGQGILRGRGPAGPGGEELLRPGARRGGVRVQLELPGGAAAHPGLCSGHAGEEGGGHPQHLLHERLHAFDQDPRLLRGQGRGEQLHPVAGGALRGHGHPGERHRPRAFWCPTRTGPCCSTRTAPPPPAPGRFWPAPPMGRFGDAEELVGGVLFLLSKEAASFITGVVLPIDGGFSAYSGV